MPESKSQIQELTERLDELRGEFLSKLNELRSDFMEEKSGIHVILAPDDIEVGFSINYDLLKPTVINTPVNYQTDAVKFSKKICSLVTEINDTFKGKHIDPKGSIDIYYSEERQKFEAVIVLDQLEMLLKKVSTGTHHLPPSDK